jgi:hypothetical protein
MMSDVDVDAAVIRPRLPGDLDACASLTHDVRRHDGYPIVLQDDVGAFLAPPSQLAA